MVRQNEIEEIIRLINDGYNNFEALSFELDIPLDDIKSYKERLTLRKFVKQAIQNGQPNIGEQKLELFLEKNPKENLIERAMLIKLRAYINKTNISEEELQKLEFERKQTGLTQTIDEILEELGVQIPKRKSSNLKKKEKTNSKSENTNLTEDLPKKQETEEFNQKPDYKSAIKKYKQQIAINPERTVNKRNLLAFAYFKAGMVSEAREELISLIDEHNSYIAYRQLIHLESCEGNLEDAKLWADDAIEKFPNSIDFREHLIGVAKKERNNKEVIRLLKEIIKINPNNEKTKEKLEKALDMDEK